MRALINLTLERTAEPVRGKRKIKTHIDGSPVVRRPSDIDSITIHQTACHFAAAKGQERHRRALGVAAHCVAFNTGEVVLSAPLLWHVNHGNKLNPRSLGLEIEGKFPGFPDKRSRFSDRLTPDGIWSACAGLQLLVQGGREIGCPIKYIHAHRQSSDSRASDPGWEIWRKIVLGYAVAVLRLEIEPDRTWGDGRSIPDSWFT